MKNFTKHAALVAALTLAFTAHASGNNNDNGPTNVTNHNTALGLGGTGGAGGQGGAGGTGIGTGIGIGSASSSASSTAVLNNRNTLNTTNRNTNMQGQGQQQGQMQGQGQSQSNKITNSGNSTSVSGAFSGGNSQSVGAVTQQNAGNNSSNSNAAQGNTTTLTYQAAQIPVATAYAASIHPTAVCALGLSGGVSGVTLGLSVGGSYIDKNCELLEQVRAANAIGARDVAMEMLMEVPSFASASKRIADRKAGGTPQTDAQKAAAVNATPKAVSDNEKYTDPIIRSRLGLPPLK